MKIDEATLKEAAKQCEWCKSVLNGVSFVKAPIRVSAQWVHFDLDGDQRGCDASEFLEAWWTEKTLGTHRK